MRITRLTCTLLAFGLLALAVCLTPTFVSAAGFGQGAATQPHKFEHRHKHKHFPTTKPA